MKQKTAISIAMIVCMLASIFAAGASAASGAGTSKDDPYVVHTYNELREAMHYSAAAAGKSYIKLGSDIDTSGENSGLGMAANQAIEFHGTATLDLNGHKLIFYSVADDSEYMLLLSDADLTICDSSKTGRGEIFYSTTKRGRNHSVVRIDSGTLTINDGVTLRALMNVHGMMANAAVWVLGGHLIVNNGRLLAEYIHGDSGGKTYDQYHSMTGITAEGNGKVTVNDGEFTGIDVYKKFRIGGDVNPDIVVNGGVFCQAMGIYAGSTLDKAGAKTLPIRINSGEFRHTQSKFGYEYQFNILVSSPVFSSQKTKFLNFDNAVGSDAWRAEVKSFMLEVYGNLFPEEAVLLVDGKVYQNTTIGAGAKISELITMPAKMNDEAKVWFDYIDSKEMSDVPKIIKVYGNLLDIKAEYDGENVPVNTIKPRFYVDPRKGGNTVTFTWKALPKELSDRGYTLDLIQLSETELHTLPAAANGDGTYSAAVTLPPITSSGGYAVNGEETDVYVALEMSKGDEYAAANPAILYLTQKYNESLPGAVLQLSEQLLAGKVSGPAVTVSGEEKRIIIESQTPWALEDDWEGDIPISAKTPIPVNAYCNTSVVLRAANGYEFMEKINGAPTRATVYVNGSDIPLDTAAVLSVSADKKTARVLIRLKATAKYEEINLTLPAPKHGANPPDRYDISGIPAGLAIESGVLWEKKESDGSYCELGRNETIRQGNTYRCGIRLTVQSETQLPADAVITVNGRKALWERQKFASDDTVFITREFYVPDPRTAIDSVMLMINDEDTQYTADTELLTGVSVGGRYKKVLSKWYNGENQAVAGTLVSGETYIYQATYRPEEGYRFEPSGFSVEIYDKGTLPASQVDVSADSLSIKYYFTVPTGIISDVSVNAVGIDVSKYSVSGKTVTVTHDRPCKLGYLDGGIYKAVPATEVENGKYSYTVPDNIEEVILVVKGDANGDGNVNSADSTTVDRATLPPSHMLHKAITNEAAFAADIDGNGTLNSADSTLIDRSILPAKHFAHKDLVF